MLIGIRLTEISSLSANNVDNTWLLPCLVLQNIPPRADSTISRGLEPMRSMGPSRYIFYIFKMIEHIVVLLVKCT